MKISEQSEREGEAPSPRSGVEGATRAPIKAMTHEIWILAVCDLIIGKAEYPAS